MKTLEGPRRLNAEKTYGSSIARVVSSLMYVEQQTRVEELAQIFDHNPDLMALGVTDSRGAYSGIVTRMHFFATLGRPFGRDILGRKPVSVCLEQVSCFSPHQNLFLVARQLEDALRDPQTTYFALCNAAGEFRGIFSSLDLLGYLSRMTQDDIDLAGNLQERMMRPRATWEGGGWRAMAAIQTAKGVGGDFCFCRDLGHHRWLFAIGDVSGKGMSAAIITSLLWGIVRSWDFDRGLKAFLQEVNTALIQTFHLEKYLTGVFFIFDSHKRSIRFADMGHGHAAIMRGGKLGTLQLPHLNLPLGIDAELVPQIFRFELKNEDMLCVWTDGLPEQENPEGEEYGQERLEKLVVEQQRHPQRIPELLFASLAGWHGDLPRHDDMTWFQLHMTDQA